MILCIYLSLQFRGLRPQSLGDLRRVADFQSVQFCDDKSEGLQHFHTLDPSDLLDELLNAK